MGAENSLAHPSLALLLYVQVKSINSGGETYRVIDSGVKKRSSGKIYSRRFRRHHSFGLQDTCFTVLGCKPRNFTSQLRSLLRGHHTAGGLFCTRDGNFSHQRFFSEVATNIRVDQKQACRYLPLHSRLVGMRLLHGLNHRSAEVDVDNVSAQRNSNEGVCIRVCLHPRAEAAKGQQRDVVYWLPISTFNCHEGVP